MEPSEHMPLEAAGALLGHLMLLVLGTGLASGQGGHSNTRSPSLRDVIDPLLVDPTNGDVHVRQGEFGYALPGVWADVVHARV